MSRSHRAYDLLAVGKILYTVGCVTGLHTLIWLGEKCIQSRPSMHLGIHSICIQLLKLLLQLTEQRSNCTKNETTSNSYNAQCPVVSSEADHGTVKSKPNRYEASLATDKSAVVVERKHSKNDGKVVNVSNMTEPASLKENLAKSKSNIGKCNGPMGLSEVIFCMKVNLWLTSLKIAQMSQKVHLPWLKSLHGK